MNLIARPLLPHLDDRLLFDVIDEAHGGAMLWELRYEEDTNTWRWYDSCCRRTNYTLEPDTPPKYWDELIPLTDNAAHFKRLCVSR